MQDTATTAAPRDAAALLNALADIGGKLADLHDDAARLGMPQAVVMDLLWLRDDAASALSNALPARHAGG